MEKHALYNALKLTMLGLENAYYQQAHMNNLTFCLLFFYENSELSLCLYIHMQVRLLENQNYKVSTVTTINIMM